MIHHEPRKLDHPACLDVLNWLEEAGAPSRFVGGCVRDHLIGRSFYDIDIATSMRPDDVMTVMNEKGAKVIPTGLKHGTVTVIHQDQSFEITTLRRDCSTDGRHAVVEFTDDWVEDASRRDFTMNALSLDLDGKLYDPFEGEKDLKAGIVKFVGNPDDRIEEDYLRLLRFFRFSAHYAKGTLDPDVLRICQKKRSGLSKLSGERIRDELMKLLSAPHPGKWLKLMKKYDVLQHVLPDVVHLDELDMLCAYEDKPDAFRRLALLFPPDQEIILKGAKSLKLSNDERDRLLAIRYHLDKITTLQSIETTRSQLYDHGADQVAHAFYIFCALNGFHALSPKDDPHFIEIEDWRQNPVSFPLKGRDLQAHEIKAGPEMGAILNKTQNWWKERGCYDGFEACLDYALSIK